MIRTYKTDTTHEMLTKQINLVLEQIEIDSQAQYTSINSLIKDVQELKAQLAVLENAILQDNPTMETISERH